MHVNIFIFNNSIKFFIKIIIQSFISNNFPNGSLSFVPPVKAPLHNGQEGLWFFQADMH